MTIITAYKCPDTGKLFEHEEKYQKHREKVLAKLAIQQKVESALKLERTWWEKNFWHSVKSISQLKAAIMLHRDVLAARGLKNYLSDNLTSRYTLKPTPVVNFSMFSASWSESVSNSHSCPHNGVINWCEKHNNRPTGYPGWHGRLEYQVQSYLGQENSYPGDSDMWTGTRIHTGTGGGGGFNKKTFTQSFGYDIKLWADDWPAMAEAYRAESFKLRLANSDINEYHLNSLVAGSVDNIYTAEEYLQRMGVDTAK